MQLANMSSATTPSSRASKPQRVLACVLCQQRKVKCDRKYPCSNCTKSQMQCVPATQISRRRKRRFPERELLERLRMYEGLLRQNNIKFEPLHKESIGKSESPNIGEGKDSDDETTSAAAVDWPSPATTVTSERKYGAKNFWHAVNHQFNRDSDSNSSGDEIRKVSFQKAWDQLLDNDDHLLFGTRTSTVNISTLHPETVHIFKFWQIYLENIDPLLKVTHTPSLQGSIIEAASNVSNIEPNLEALMFSIYCMALSSLEEEDCQKIFGASKVDLLTRYQFGCQQALMNCGFLRCEDRDCLTALYLYLLSVRPDSVPRSLSTLLGVAIRIAQRMGINNESILAKSSPLEAELRRRLWWSLVLYDTRIGEMADYKAATLIPTWDCRIPANVNDSNLRLEMKDPPQSQVAASDAIFAVVRSEVGDFIRHTAFHLDFSNPALKSAASDVKLDSFAKRIEETYLKSCDPENPLHFMTIWMTRAYLAKCRLIEHFSKSFTATFQTEEAELERDGSLLHGIEMLECDTKITTSPQTRGYHWLLNNYFPATAYIHLSQCLKRRPLSEHADQAWEAMSNNFEVRIGAQPSYDSLFYKILANIILNGWKPREVVSQQSGEPLVVPRIIVSIRQKLAQFSEGSDSGRSMDGVDMAMNDFPMTMPMDFGTQSLLYSMGGQDSYAAAGPGDYLNMPGLASLIIDANQLDWSAMDWNLFNEPASKANPSEPVAPRPAERQWM